MRPSFDTLDTEILVSLIVKFNATELTTASDIRENTRTVPDSIHICATT